MKIRISLSFENTSVGILHRKIVIYSSTINSICFCFHKTLPLFALYYAEIRLFCLQAIVPQVQRPTQPIYPSRQSFYIKKTGVKVIK